MTALPLHDGWTLRPVDGPIPVDLVGAPIPAVVPGCVHTDLLRAGLIADPFDGDNEAAQQWIGDTVWEYRCAFDAAPRRGRAARSGRRGPGHGRHRHPQRRGARADREPTPRLPFRHGVGAAGRPQRARRPVRRARAGGTATVGRTRPAAARQPPPVQRACERWPATSAGTGASTSPPAASGRPIGIDGWSGVRIASVRPLVDVDGETGVLTAHVELERAKSGPAGGSLFSAAGDPGAAAVPSG